MSGQDLTFGAVAAAAGILAIPALVGFVSVEVLPRLRALHARARARAWGYACEVGAHEWNYHEGTLGDRRYWSRWCYRCNTWEDLGHDD